MQAGSNVLGCEEAKRIQGISDEEVLFERQHEVATNKIVNYITYCNILQKHFKIY